MSTTPTLPNSATATSAAAASAPSLPFALLFGGLSLGAVSTIAYIPWAFHLLKRDAVLYSVTAAVYMVIGGLALSRLIADAPARKRFPLWFALAFLIYAVGWCGLWFGLKGKWQADWWGALVGLAGMTLLWQRLYGRSGDFLRLFAGLLVLHCAGYYLGGALYAKVRGDTGKLLWGAAHGVGFGAGIGYVLWRCQTSLKNRLPSAPPA